MNKILKFSELTPAQQRDARFTFSPLYAYDAFLYEVDAKGNIGGRSPIPSR